MPLNKVSVVLFDWGNTLMVDFENQKGKMCDWDKVATMPGAEKLLHSLSQTHQIYIATNAKDSKETDILKAFERVNLAQFISGYFCKSNVGVEKKSAEFCQRILAELGVSAEQVMMVGDNYTTDIEPAIKAGLSAVWLTDSMEKRSLLGKVSVCTALEGLLV